MATSLVASPGLLIAWELNPLGGGIGGGTAAVLPGLKFGKSLHPEVFCGQRYYVGAIIYSARLAGTDVILIHSTLFYSRKAET